VHKMLSVDVENRVGVCLECGPVQLKFNKDRGPRCANSRKGQKDTRRGRVRGKTERTDGLYSRSDPDQRYLVRRTYLVLSRARQRIQERGEDVSPFMLSPKGRQAVRDLIRNTEKCYLCGAKLGLRERGVDHKTPLSRGGVHELHNLGICCFRCNRAKNDMTLEEFTALAYQIWKYQSGK
jgi:5-methylcytosine-specific restriction endonuclease McrA